jgi:hypothetical protein
MHGEFDRARELIQTARAMFIDLGQTYALASSAESSGLVEMLAGDLSAAEQELRRGVELLEGMGERAYLSTLGAMLADVLELVDKDDEAVRFPDQREGIRSRRHRLPGPLASGQSQAPGQAGPARRG